MKKLPPTIKKQLTTLRQISLDDASKEQMKSSLQRELGISQASGNAGIKSKAVFFAARQSFQRLSLKPLSFVALGLAIVVGPGIATVSAARASLPGDALYTVKRNIEEFQIKLSFSEASRAEKQVQFVAYRLHELQRITQEQAPSPEREQKIVLALAELKKNTNQAKAALETVETSSERDDVIALARSIEEKTTDYKESLKKSAALADEEHQSEDDLDLALSSVQEVALGALSILAESQENNEEVNKDVLREKVTKQLALLKSQVDNLRARVDEKDLSEEAQETSSSADDEETEPKFEADTELEAETVSDTHPARIEAQDQAASVRKALDEDIAQEILYIEELINLGQLSAALDKITETKNKVDAYSLQVRLMRKQQEEASKSPEPEQTDEAAEEVNAAEPEFEEEVDDNESEESDNDETVEESEEESEVDEIDILTE